MRFNLYAVVNLLTLVLLTAVWGNPGDGQTVRFEYKPAPIDNPLKGLVPYWGQTGPFPCSMEFWYFPIRDLMKGPTDFDWSSIEAKLEDVRSRGHQMVIRTYLEYPGKPSAMPDYLAELGVPIYKYSVKGKEYFTPDYKDPRLLKAMEDFVAAFGKKFDGDPRIGFMTMGVLGHWGEWHTYPKEKLFATKPDQTKIQEAFANAFQKTKILMRYPSGTNAWAQAPNDQFPFGYHDDSFAWATLATGKPSDDWYFEAALKSAGEKAINKWKTQPIGGEIRPEIWGCVFDTPSCAPQGQSFEEAVKRLHVTWLMDSGMFAYADPPPTPQRIAEATRQVRRMGYEFFAKSASIEPLAGRVSITVDVENTGVAPFYYDWPVQIVCLDSAGMEVGSERADWKLPKLLPGETNTWRVTLTPPANAVEYAIRIPNPMTNGKPIRFANETQQDNGLLLLK